MNETSKNLFLLLTLFLVTIVILLTPNVHADIISLNSGGNDEIAVTTEKYIEGFFFGIPEETTTTATSSTSGGGGGSTTFINISVVPNEFNLNLAVNTTINSTIRVTNLGASSITVGVSQSGLNNHVMLNKTFLVIPAKGAFDLDAVFYALSEPGIFTGKIKIGSRDVLVTLNVKTQLLLFDSNIVVLNPGFKVAQRGSLKTLVTLTPLGDPEGLDMTLNFSIKDYDGKVYLIKSETLTVEGAAELKRNFDIGSLSLGDYVIGLEFTYPNGAAPSSAQFKVVRKDIFGDIIFFLIIMILIIAILITIIQIRKRIENRRKKP